MLSKLKLLIVMQKIRQGMTKLTVSLLSAEVDSALRYYVVSTFR
jgi:hypothetical protein